MTNHYEIKVYSTSTGKKVINLAGLSKDEKDEYWSLETLDIASFDVIHELSPL